MHTRSRINTIDDAAPDVLEWAPSVLCVYNAIVTNTNEQTRTPNDIDTITALEQAFIDLGLLVENANTQSAIKAISRAIIAALLAERAMNTDRYAAILINQTQLRGDLQALIAAINNNKDYVGGRIHQIAGFVTALEFKIGELAEVMTVLIDAEHTHTHSNEPYPNTDPVLDRFVEFP